MTAIAALPFSMISQTSAFVAVRWSQALILKTNDFDRGCLRMRYNRVARLSERNMPTKSLNMINTAPKDQDSNSNNNNNSNKAIEQAKQQHGDDCGGSNNKLTFLDELIERCTEATRSNAATESPHTGSSEWAGFRTTPELLKVRGMEEEGGGKEGLHERGAGKPSVVVF